MKRLRKLTITTRYVLMVGILLLAANTALGFLVLNSSRASMQTLINKNMLDVVKSAAGTLDGDVLGALTEDDVDGEDFNHIAEQLTVFTDSVDIHFIYAVKQTGPDTYVFTVDPDPVDPGEFGEEVLVTDALRTAGSGVPAADDKPAADRWGNFYSAYCPVFDSKGEIAGIVGIDFDAEWYENQIREYTYKAIFFTILSVLVCSFLVFLMTHRVRRRFTELSSEISSLSSKIDMLMNDLSDYTGFDAESYSSKRSDYSENTASDEMGVLSDKIHAMQNDMSVYLEYLHKQAYTDALTHVRNTSAYHERIEVIDALIKENNIDFTVIVFDLNNLKILNDTVGHECGDAYIRGAGGIISQVFGEDDTYRIGGDEFAAVKEWIDQDSLNELIKSVKSGFEGFIRNSDNPFDMELSVSIGYAVYDPETDDSYKSVFARADREMYIDKKKYHND